MLICAFRDNEVHPGHPWVTLINELKQQQVIAVDIMLFPLETEYVSELVAATLRAKPDEVAELSELITAKTGGNPFFVRQFLKSMHERELLQFDNQASCWHWNVEKIADQQITDNVVDLITTRIHKLDTNAQRLTQLAACIGNRCDLYTLSVVFGKSAAETAEGLQSVLQKEIMVPVGEAYKFVQSSDSATDPAAVFYRFPHDRLQQAAYQTIPESERPGLHERIGRLILGQSTAVQIEERLFEIVNHLNFTTDRIESENETVELAGFNLRAGLKAKDSSAYDAALEYLVTGSNLLSGVHHDEPELSYQLTLQRAEVSYLLGRFGEAETLAENLYSNTSDTLQKVKALDLLVLKHTTALEYGEAIDDAISALALLGEKIPRSPSQPQLLRELAMTKLAIGNKSTTDLRNLQRMHDQNKLAAMRVLMLATPPAYFDDPNLMPYLALRMVRLSVKYGNADHSAYGYIAYGLVLCGVLNDMKQGQAFGELALELVEMFNAQDIRGKVQMVYGGFIMHWNGKILDTLPMYMQGAAASLEAGDLEFHGYSRYAHASYHFFGGTPLERVADLLVGHNTAVRIHRHEKTDRIMRMVRQAVRDLRGENADPRPSDEPVFDEKANLALWAERDRQALAYFYKYRIITQFMKHDFNGCLDSASEIGKTIHAVMGMIYVVSYRTFESLALCALIPDMVVTKRPLALAKVRINVTRMRRWSRHAPENYLHKYYMLRAEYDRVRGRAGQAVSHYEMAINLAQQHGAIHDLALIHELAGEYYLSHNQMTAAKAHLIEARDAFRRWGALAWVQQLEMRHPAIYGEKEKDFGNPGALTVTDSNEGVGFIDVQTITNAARAISEKIVTGDVLHEVMKAAMVNAGATRGLLLLDSANGLHIEAESTSRDGKTIVQSEPLAKSGKVPVNIVNYVLTSRRSTVLDDTPNHPVFSTDAYIKQHKPLSVLCLPIIDKGEIKGLLYLENELIRGAFTSSRIQTLEVLAAQASISLENARLYTEVSDHANSLEHKVTERTRELEDAYTTLREVFGKYVPKRVAETVVMSSGSLKPTQTIATMLYSDIEGFTGIVEQMPPDQVMEMLNEYFPAVIEPIDRNGGIVNQFQGDAMLVTFNVPIADIHHAEKAVKTALEIQRVLHNRTFAGMTLRTRIGINTGEIIAGNIGSGDRFNYTVHGDAVNLSARIEQLNKEYGTSVLVSGSTVDLLNDNYPLRQVGQVDIRGKTEPVQLFELFGGQSRQTNSSS